jgi:hypothetical protein
MTADDRFANCVRSWRRRWNTAPKINEIEVDRKIAVQLRLVTIGSYDESVSSFVCAHFEATSGTYCGQ